jgi:hypothetical protein
MTAHGVRVAEAGRGMDTLYKVNPIFDTVCFHSGMTEISLFFQFYLDTQKRPLELPEAIGPKVILSEKVFVPVKEHPDFNFVGRILGEQPSTGTRES